MNTGSSYLLTEDLHGNCDVRGRFDDATSWLDLPTHDAPGFDARTFEQPAFASAGRATPLRALEPADLEAANDDVDDYAARCLESTSLDALFDVVIATAEMRAGRTVVRDVLVELSMSPDGRTAEELAGGDDEKCISVAHVLAVLGNHLHRIRNRYRLSPVLRSAVERRYPLGKEAVRPNAYRVPMPSVEGPAARVQRMWREHA